MGTTLANVLFKDYRRRVLGLLLLHPEKQYHVRQIARLTDTVAGTLHKELSKLAEAGLLVKERIGHQVFYRADSECIIFQELSSILRKTSGIADLITEMLSPLAKKIDTAFIFGSVAAQTETSFSDIDLVVIGRIKFGELVEVLLGAQEILDREINPKVYSRKEWTKLRDSKDGFVTEVLRKPKIFIIGTEHELE